MVWPVRSDIVIMRRLFSSLAMLGLIAAIGGCGSSTDAGDATDPEARLAEAQRVMHQVGATSALAMINDIVHDHPDFVEAHLFKGRLHHELEKFDEALVAAEWAVKLDSDSGTAHLDRAIYLRELGREEEAFEALDRTQECAMTVIEVNAFDVDAKLNLVMVAHLRGNSRSALDQINLIVADRPHSNKAKSLKRFLEGKVVEAAVD